MRMMTGWKYLFVLICSMFFGLNLYAQENKTKTDSNCKFDHKPPENSITNIDSSEIFIEPYEMPVFKWEEGDFYTYIKKNLKFPVANNCQEGTVYIQATIDSNGQVKDVILRKGICPLFDNEAIRLISTMPKWIPAKFNGKVTDMKLTIPIKFKSDFYK